MQETFENIKTVFFDLDDTLWDFTENSRVALKKTYFAFNRPNWACTYEQFVDIYHRHNADLWQRYSRGEIDVDYLRSERFRATLEEVTGYAQCVPLAQELDSYYLEYLSSLSLLIPDAKYIMEYLRRKGYKIGILSNGFKGIQQRKMKHSDIEKYIDYVVLSEDVGITKPQRGIFDAALEVCGCKADEVVMVGDNPVTDIRGAVDAGWRAILLSKENETEVDSHVITIRQLKEIMSYL